MFVMRNILFKFRAIFSHVNKRFPVQSENSTEWKSAFSQQGLFVSLNFTLQLPYFIFDIRIVMTSLNNFLPLAQRDSWPSWFISVPFARNPLFDCLSRMTCQSGVTNDAATNSASFQLKFPTTAHYLKAA